MHLDRRNLAGVSVLVIVAMLFFMAAVGNAQVTTATLTGTVFDTSGAVVPNANVTLTSQASGILRKTISNGEGYFAFAAIPPGTYSLLVEMPGFKNWEATTIALNASDERNILGIKLQPGAPKEVVIVEASAVQMTPVNSGEKSSLITERVMQNVAIQGINAAEFIKIMPGMAMTGGVVNQASYQASDERTGNGPVQNFAPNGLRVAAMDITSDGAHIVDPGCNCGQAENTTIDMTAELKVMTSNYGADQAKGPVVVQAVGKSGGQQFHGETYLYGRYYTLNANDPLNKAAGDGPNGPLSPRPQTKYFYPGVNLSGPVIFPGTNFNRSRNKLFFFVGFQYNKQTVDNGTYEAVVPTQDMRNGIFNDLKPTVVNGAGCPDPHPQSFYGSHVPAGYPSENCYVNLLNGSSITQAPTGAGTNGAGIVTAIDPNGQRLMNLYPLPNITNVATSGPAAGWNYINALTRYSNFWQLRVRGDYNLTDSTKLYVTWNRQRDDAQESLDTLWTGNAQSWDDPTTPYPSPLVESTHSDVITASLTHVFSPTLTNELVFTYTFLNLPNQFADPSKVNRQGLGLNYQLLFSHPNQGQLIFPQMTGWGNGISNFLNAGFELNGIVYAKKTLPTVEDNISKVWGTHTSKFGFYWERTWNSQPGNNPVNGTAVFANWGSNYSGNAYADMLKGQTTDYSEQNFDTVPAFRYITTDFYGMDSWKVSRRVTLEYGIRASHLGPWSDTTGYGFADWFPSLYNGTSLSGLEWHKIDSSVPLSGSKSRALFVNPHLGFAWDVFGTGRTILRGGYGLYRYHDEQNVQNPAYSITQGSYNKDVGSIALSALAPFSGALSPPSGVGALDPNDSEEPRTQSYSLTIAQRTPWNGVLEVAYVGDKADYLGNYNNNFGQINDLGIGALFAKYGWIPDQGSSAPAPCNPWETGTSYCANQTSAARPLTAYGTLKITNHMMYSNYNSLQVSWNKQAGHFYFMTNYTFSKALGIRGENGSASGDPLNLKDNYGTLPNNRTHIFNAAYVYEFPNLGHGNAVLKGVVNHWQISGIAQYQSGADLQASYNANFNYSFWLPAGTTFMGRTLAADTQVNNQMMLGTPDITLMPKVTCNPKTGLATHQYINGNCFTTTPIGVQGDYIFPSVTGPGFFNTDLSLFKNFTWGPSENKKLQFRFSGYNFLNHPNRTFTNSDPNLNLQWNQQGVLNPTFGFAESQTGHRIMQAMVKFSW